MLNVYANNVVFWYVAASAEEAGRMHCEDVACSMEDLTKYELDFKQVPDDVEIAIVQADDTILTKTAGEWVKQNGPGFLATTEY